MRPTITFQLEPSPLASWKPVRFIFSSRNAQLPDDLDDTQEVERISPYLAELVVCLIEAGAVGPSGTFENAGRVCRLLSGHPDEHSLYEYSYRLCSVGLELEWGTTSVGERGIRLRLPAGYSQISIVTANPAQVLKNLRTSVSKPVDRLEIVEEKLAEISVHLFQGNMKAVEGLISSEMLSPTWLNRHLGRRARRNLVSIAPWLYEHQANFYMQKGPPNKSLRAADKAFAMFAAQGNRQGMARVQALKVAALRIAGELDRARETAEYARHLAEPLCSKDGERESVQTSTLSSTMAPEIVLGNWDSALRLADQAVEAALREGNLVRACEASFRQSEVHLHQGRLQQAELELAEARRLFADDPDGRWLDRWLARFDIELALRQGRWNEQLAVQFQAVWRDVWNDRTTFQVLKLVHLLDRIVMRFGTESIEITPAMIQHIAWLHQCAIGAYPRVCPRGPHHSVHETVRCLLQNWRYLRLG